MTSAGPGRALYPGSTGNARKVRNRREKDHASGPELSAGAIARRPLQCAPWPPDHPAAPPNREDHAPHVARSHPAAPPHLHHRLSRLALHARAGAVAVLEPDLPRLLPGQHPPPVLPAADHPGPALARLGAHLHAHRPGRVRAALLHHHRHRRRDSAGDPAGHQKRPARRAPAAAAGQPAAQPHRRAARRVRHQPGPGRPAGADQPLAQRPRPVRLPPGLGPGRGCDALRVPVDHPDHDPVRAARRVPPAGRLSPRPLAPAGRAQPPAGPAVSPIAGASWSATP